MTTGQRNDKEATKAQIMNRTQSITGATWLRHRANTQASVIDLMILEGRFTIEDIAKALNDRELKKQPLSQRIKRVEDHIAHLQDGVGDSRGHWNGMKPHGLKIKIDSANKLRFDP
jgi:hypothetical protein